MEDDLFEEKLEAYPALGQISNTEFFAKIVNEFQSISIFTKSSFSDVWLDSEYVSESYFFKVC